MISERIYLDFINDRNIKPATIKNYSLSLRNYMNHTGLTLQELIDEADEEEDKQIRMKRRQIKNRLLSFRNHLIQEGQTKKVLKLKCQM